MYRSEKAAYTTDAGPIDIEALAEQLEYDLAEGAHAFSTIQFYLGLAYDYGNNHGWYHAQDKELTKRNY